MTVIHGTMPTTEDYEPMHFPGNVETAPFGAAVDATWEDLDLISLINAATTGDDIDTGRRVKLRGTLEVLSGDAAVHAVKYASGGTPDNDDTVKLYSTGGAAQSYFIPNVVLITDNLGQIKIEADVILQATFVFHLESYQYAQVAAGS
jgi:hypothetical protein